MFPHIFLKFPPFLNWFLRLTRDEQILVGILAAIVAIFILYKLITALAKNLSTASAVIVLILLFFIGVVVLLSNSGTLSNTVRQLTRPIFGW